MVLHTAFSLQRTIEVHVKPQRTRLTRHDPYHNHMIRQRGKGRTLVGHTVGREFRGGNGVAQIQLALVVTHLLHTLEVQFHTSQR